LASGGDSGGESDAGVFGEVIDFISEKAAEAGKATQEAMNTAGDTLGEFGTNVSEQIGSAVSDVSDYLNGLGQNISDVAAQVSEAATSISQDIADQSSTIADQALTTLEGAVNVVVDGTGNIVNMASEGVEAVSSSATQALDTITTQGNDLITLADKAIIGLNLTDPENIEKARKATDQAIEVAYNNGLLGKNLNLESVQIIKDIIFGTAVYGYQYSHGNITLPEYALLMSKIIIKAGLPVGVGYIASQLPIPGADQIAKEVTAFLIKVAYGEGEEEVLYEDTETLPESSDQ
jgi:hypothetical protein